MSKYIIINQCESSYGRQVVGPRCGYCRTVRLTDFGDRSV